MAGKQILLVEDSATLAQVIETSLAHLGHQVQTFALGLDAIATIEKAPPDLVLLDDTLSDLSPLGFVQKLETLTTSRALAAREMPPVILLSTRTHPQGPPYRDELRKPFSPETLKGVVTSVLGGPSREGAPLPQIPGIAGQNSRTPDLSASTKVLPLSDTLGLLEKRASNGRLTVRRESLSEIQSLVDSPETTRHENEKTKDKPTRQQQIDIFFVDGQIRLARAQGLPESLLLGHFLVQTGALTPESLKDALTARVTAHPSPESKDAADDRHKGSTDSKPANRKRKTSRQQKASSEVYQQTPQTRTLPLLGDTLCDKGLISRDQLTKALVEQTKNLLFESLTWESAQLDFEAGQIDAKGQNTLLPADLPIKVPELLLAGLRKVDRWRLIEREIGSLDVVFVCDEGAAARLGPNTLLEEEQKVLNLVTGLAPVRDIVFNAKLGSYGTFQILFRLKRMGLIFPRRSPTET